MNGLETYRLFQSIRLHFKNSKYNVIESRGRIRGCTQEVFDNRNDKYLFEKLGKKFDKLSDLAMFFVSNFAYGNDQVIYSDESFDNYIEWKRRRESITKIFDDDYVIIKEQPNPFVVMGAEPTALKLYLSKKITLESLCILDIELDIINKYHWNDIDILWKDVFLLIKKTSCFVKYKKDNILKIIEGD